MPTIPAGSAKGSSADYEMSTQAVCGALGMRLEELPDWNCCGSTPAHAVDTELSAALCVRNLDIAARTQADMVVTPCPSCLSNLRHAAKRMEKPEFRARVNELLDNPAAESFPPVTSVMQGIAQMYDAKAIASRVKRSLRGLKLVAYYGCLMSRPAELMQFGDPENPTLMEEAAGRLRRRDAGLPAQDRVLWRLLRHPGTSHDGAAVGPHPRSGHQHGRRRHRGACPLCQMNLDLRQKQAMKGVDRYFNMPVLYYTQVMGLASACCQRTGPRQAGAQRQRPGGAHPRHPARRRPEGQAPEGDKA